MTLHHHVSRADAGDLPPGRNQAMTQGTAAPRGLATLAPGGFHRAGATHVRARKFRPNWDDGFYMARSDPERIAKPRIQGTVIELPKRVRLDPARAIEAWADIGLKVDEPRIREHLAEIEKWERRIK